MEVPVEEVGPSTTPPLLRTPHVPQMQFYNENNHVRMVSFLASLFRRKSGAIVITRSSSCKNFNVAHYLKSIKGINTKLRILAHHDKMQLQDKGHNEKLDR